MKRLPVRVLLRFATLSCLFCLFAFVHFHALAQVVGRHGETNSDNTQTRPSTPSELTLPVIEDAVSGVDPTLIIELTTQLSSWSRRELPGTRYQIAHYEERENWRLLTLVSLDGPEAVSEMPGAGSNSALALAYRNDDGEWTTAIAGTTAFSRLLMRVPESIIPASAKVYLDPLRIGALEANSTEYLFPWPAASWEYRQGWHQSALDIGTRDNSR